MNATGRLEPPAGMAVLLCLALVACAPNSDNSQPPTGPSQGGSQLFSGTFKGTSTITSCVGAVGLPTAFGFCANDVARQVDVQWPAAVVFERTGGASNFSGWFQFFEGNPGGYLRYRFSAIVVGNSISATITNNLPEHRVTSLIFSATDASSSYTGTWQMSVAENRGVPGDNTGSLMGRLSLTRAPACQFDVLC